MQVIVSKRAFYWIACSPENLSLVKASDGGHWLQDGLSRSVEPSPIEISLVAVAVQLMLPREKQTETEITTKNMMTSEMEVVAMERKRRELVKWVSTLREHWFMFK